MPHTNADLAELIGSRICHDLISPIGAIANGLELMELSGQAASPEFDLIADSVRNANGRIRFFRIAFGASGDATLGRPEILSVLDDFSRAGRIGIDWHPPGPALRSLVRAAFLGILCCETALPYGGTVRVESDGAAWRVTGNAPKINADPALWSVLQSPGAAPDIGAAQVQFLLLPQAVAAAGRALEVAAGEDGIAIRF